MTVPPTAIEVLRFMKLSKMLRLARLKELMMKHEQSLNRTLKMRLSTFSASAAATSLFEISFSSRMKYWMGRQEARSITNQPLR